MVPFSKLVNTGGGADLGVCRGKEQGKFDSLHFGQIKFQRPRGRWRQRHTKGPPGLRWWNVPGSESSVWLVTAAMGIDKTVSDCGPQTVVPGQQHLHHLERFPKCRFVPRPPDLLNQNFWGWEPAM